MTCLVLAKAEENPATRYRAKPLVDALRARGHKVKVSFEPNSGAQLGLLLGQYDLVFIQRKLFNPIFTRLLRKRCKALLFDFDDAIFLKSDGSVSQTRLKRFEAVTEAADTVIPGNEYLAQSASKARRTKVIPTCIDIGRYAVAGHRATTPIDLVWIGSRSTAKYLHQHAEVLERLGECIPNLRLKVIADFQLRLNHLEVVNITWNPDNEVRELANGHIGIAPMVDDAWTRGKCALKIIQYMAASLPVVSSNVGANQSVVHHETSGFLANSSEQWIESVRALVTSETLRSEMGKEGRRLAEQKYSITASIDGLLQEIDQLVAL